MRNQLPTTTEERLYQAFLDWTAQARKLWLDYEQSGLDVPAPLKRALMDSETGAGSKGGARTPALRPPAKPPRPPQAEDDWIWIDVREASPRTIVLAVLNNGRNWLVKEVLAKVKEHIDVKNDGSIYNICAQEPKILKTELGLTLKHDANAPVIHQKHVWGNRDSFQKQDLAAFRRKAIEHLLETSPDGLQTMQVLRQLETAVWLHTPLNKDLVKADLFVMKDDKIVKMLGNSKKWTLNKTG